VLRTAGAVLSPGLVSYQVVIGVVACHAASDRSPSMVTGDVRRETGSVSPESAVCAGAGATVTTAEASATRASRAARVDRMISLWRVHDPIGLILP